MSEKTLQAYEKLQSITELIETIYDELAEATITKSLFIIFQAFDKLAVFKKREKDLYDSLDDEELLEIYIHIEQKLYSVEQTDLKLINRVQRMFSYLNYLFIEKNKYEILNKHYSKKGMIPNEIFKKEKLIDNQLEQEYSALVIHFIDEKINESSEYIPFTETKMRSFFINPQLESLYLSDNFKIENPYISSPLTAQTLGITEKEYLGYKDNYIAEIVSCIFDFIDRVSTLKNIPEEILLSIILYQINLRVAILLASDRQIEYIKHKLSAYPDSSMKTILLKAFDSKEKDNKEIKVLSLGKYI